MTKTNVKRIELTAEDVQRILIEWLEDQGTVSVRWNIGLEYEPGDIYAMNPPSHIFEGCLIEITSKS